MSSKHLVIIHGRDKKPVCEVMEGLVRKSLAAGLRRVDEDTASMLEKGAVKLTFVYYGDINNRLLLERQDMKPREDYWIKQHGKWYVRPDFYEEDLQRLIARPTAELNKEAYKELVRDQPWITFKDELAGAVSPFLSLFDMSYRAIRKLLPDLGAYLDSRVVGSQIRERLQAPLGKALNDGEDVMLISHSMGCMVAYDVLWKFSRMSEYKQLWQRRVQVWLTIGNPLGEPSVLNGLYDSNEPEDGRYPTNVNKWININAVDDYIAHDQTIADDFRPMISRQLVQELSDGPAIYNLWKDNKGRCNPHNLFGYLNHPDVASQVARWISS